MRSNFDRALADAKANLERLDRCEGPHEFEPKPGQPPMLADHICKLCGGVLSRLYLRWYKRGLEHGRKERCK